MRSSGCLVLVVLLGCSDGSSPSPDGGGGMVGNEAGVGGAPGTGGGPGTGGVTGTGGGTGGVPGTGGTANPDGGAAGAGGTAIPDGGAVDAAPAAPLPDFASGTRLRAMVYQATGGAKQWHGWYDNQLKSVCTFAGAEDGATRCLPTGEYTSYYADAECKTPVYHHNGTCAKPAFVWVSGDTCGNTRPIYDLGAAITPAALYYRPGLTCSPTEIPGNGTLHALTKRPASDFVPATQVNDARGNGGLAMTFLKAADGAIQPVEMFDNVRQTQCRPGIYATAANSFADRCVPSAQAIASAGTAFFSDATCATLLAHTNTCLENKVKVEVLVTLDYSDVCAPKYVYSYAELGAKWSGQVHQGSPAQCSVTNITAFTQFQIGAAITPASLPQLTTVDVGTGRIKARYFKSSSDERLIFSTFVDSDSGQACRPLLTSDGLRCVDSRSSDYSSYSDDQCQKQVVYVGKPAMGCTAKPPAITTASISPVDVCQPNHHRVFSVGAAIGSQSVYTLNQGVCDVTGTDPNNLVFFDTTEIPPSTLGQIQDVTE